LGKARERTVLISYSSKRKKRTPFKLRGGSASWSYELRLRGGHIIALCGLYVFKHVQERTMESEAALEEREKSSEEAFKQLVQGMGRGGKNIRGKG